MPLRNCLPNFQANLFDVWSKIFKNGIDLRTQEFKTTQSNDSNAYFMSYIVCHTSAMFDFIPAKKYKISLLQLCAKYCA